jgi:hypothetical protein
LGDLGNSTGVAWADYDLDGDQDLYLRNYGQQSKLLRNDGGDAFTAITSGPLGNVDDGTGAAWSDYDGDGDLDLYAANDGQSCVLLRNDLPGGHHWLHFRLVGRVSNRSGIGARVKVTAGGVSQIQEVSGGGGYFSQNSLALEFGLGGAATADSVVVLWPSGYQERYLSVPANQRLTLTELDVVAVGDHPPAAPPLAFAAPSPNPSHGIARFRFSLPDPLRVRLLLYDVHGRRAATLVDGVRGPGWHAVTWSGRGEAGRELAAGVYWARLETALGTQTHKLVYMP